MIVHPNTEALDISCARCGADCFLWMRSPIPSVEVLLCTFCWMDWKRIVSLYKLFTYNREKEIFFLRRYKWWIPRG